MSYLGDFRLGDTLDFHFTTRQISGAPFTLAGSPVISAYPSNSTTQLTAGITLDVDFDSVTGLNHVRVVASNGNGYATATDYSLVITTGTVNSVSVVGEVIGNFSIEHRSALMPATGGRTLVVDAAGLADANTVKLGPTGSGTAQTAKDVGGAVPAAAAGASGGLLISGSNAGTTILGALTVTGATTLTGAVTGTNASNNLTGVTAALTGDLTATMKTSVTTAATAATPAAASVTGAVGSVTGNVGGNVTGSVGSVVGAVGSVTGNVGGNVVGSVASVTAGVTVTTNNDKTGYALTSGNNNTIAGLVWDVTLSSHLTAGSTGFALNAAGSAGDPWSTAIPGAYGAGTAGFIVGNNLDAAVSSRVAAASFTFTVPGYADVNIRYVNSVAVTGAGTSGSPWGP